MGSMFGSKPSEAHVIWRSGRDSGGKKKFDFEYLELWAAHFGVDFEQWTRVDHDRGDEPREQFACVFRWSQSGGQELSVGDEEWTMGSQRKPRTFLEIDEEGMVRLRGWTSETTLDVEELVLKKTVLTLKTADSTVKKLDVRKLSKRPETPTT
ncbi:hypothetical protein Har1130_06450 [Haloarcula sp. CBA1130]|uniref:hypothetical protein n=1 Tax=unclassified Haloarcula TaxID=2624677 RepID=UPI0012477A9C|nr:MULTISPECIES: hypothetical protein [unclassified Haloarcula]KAA9397916.1 hypothetical protein Har1129_06690 [Haloarcula sp. CBA1129]KAA9402395.1 hypothetical protein Har1130_06450 [Haloarcula sp. CBA1130]